MEEEKNTNKETYEQTIRKRPVMRIMAWVCIVIILGLIIATFVTGITGSPYFMACLALAILVPILFYAVLWLGRVLNNHTNKQS